jgi:hypothetical protein
MKKIIFVFLISFALALCLFLGGQYYLSSHNQKGALQITSSPISKVYLNNKYIGRTPLCQCDTADMVATGEYIIRLVPLDTHLKEFQEKITITPSVLTVVDRKFGTNAQSEGSIISLEPLENKQKSELLVVSFPQGANVALDGQNIGQTPIVSDNPTESDHTITVTKEGYNEKEVRIRTPISYKLTVSIYLGTGTTDLTASNAAQTATQAASEMASTPSATQTAKEQKVTILDTPTGFLRVREKPSTSAAEVGKVIPKKSYLLNNEVYGWYEITTEYGATGWISSQYATKKQ